MYKTCANKFRGCIKIITVLATQHFNLNAVCKGTDISLLSALCLYGSIYPQVFLTLKNLARPSQIANWGTSTCAKRKSTSPCLLAIPAFDRSAGLYNSHLNTLRTGLLNCLNARSRDLIFRHRASCI